jgi:hypothetical protein
VIFFEKAKTSGRKICPADSCLLSTINLYTYTYIYIHIYTHIHSLVFRSQINLSIQRLPIEECTGTRVYRNNGDSWSVCLFCRPLPLFVTVPFPVRFHRTEYKLLFSSSPATPPPPPPSLLGLLLLVGTWRGRENHSVLGDGTQRAYMVTVRIYTH